MRILDYMERLQTLTRLLKKEHTGSAAKIAKEMGVHRNTIINYFLELRAMGAEIEYDNERNTYYFKKSFDIQLKIKISEGQHKKVVPVRPYICGKIQDYANKNYKNHSCIHRCETASGRNERKRVGQ